MGEGSLSAFAAPLSELSARLHALNITPAGETAGEETPDLLQPDHLSAVSYTHLPGSSEQSRSRFSP